MGYTARQIRHRFIKHSSDPHSLYTNTCRIQITKKDHEQYTYLPTPPPPLLTKDKNDWLRQKEYHWICKVATLNKLHDRDSTKQYSTTKVNVQYNCTHTNTDLTTSISYYPGLSTTWCERHNALRHVPSSASICHVARG